MVATHGLVAHGLMRGSVLAVRGARLGRVLGSAVHGAWFGRDVCACVHGSVATHGLVAHGLIFLCMIEPCG